MTGTVPLNALPHPALVVAADGTVETANPAARERWGDVEGAGVETILADGVEGSGLVEPIESRAGESGADESGADESRSNDQRDAWRDELRLRGDRRDLLADVSITGLADGALVVARDVSADEAAREGAAMLDALLSEIPVSVYFKDRDSRHVRVSENLAVDVRENEEGKIVHAADDVHGKTEFDLYPYDVAEPAVADDEQVMETGERIERRAERVERRDGEVVYHTTSKAPWYDAGGNVVGIVGVTVETTAQRRQAEELKRQNERLEQFASVVSHDLRNPLEVATAKLELYRDTGDESLLPDVARMHERMSHLIDDTLELARGGEPVVEPTDVEGAAVAHDAWSAVDTRGATLTCEWDAAVAADPVRLGRLFENCFRNAIDHGGPDVAVRVVGLPDEPGFAIEDDGPGVPSADRTTIFERGVTTSEDGTGFGLSIVREIAQAHGWNVSVTESEAGGARFEFGTAPPGASGDD